MGWIYKLIGSPGLLVSLSKSNLNAGRDLSSSEVVSVSIQDTPAESQKWRTTARLEPMQIF